MKNIEIDIEEVKVKDDILIVINGDQICTADCTVLECDGLEVNESMLTGESKPVKKKQEMS